MSVSLNPAGTIVLAGVCPVEDTEALLNLMQRHPSAPLDWTQCTALHTAVLQVILAARPVLTGPCGDRFVAEWVRFG